MKHALLLLLLAVAGTAAADIEYWPQGDQVCVDSPLRLTFDHPPEFDHSGKLEVHRASDGAVVETVDLSAGPLVDRFGATGGYLLKYEPAWVEGNTACVRLPTGTLAHGESYVVRISPGFVKDFAGVQEGWAFRTKPAPARNPERLTVATDGTGDCCTVQGAVNQVEPHRSAPVEIFIRKGHYRELVRVGRERRFVRLVGENRDATVISYTNNEKLNTGWIQRSVLGIEADDFGLENLTVQNTTPYKGSQAEAVYVNAERAVLRHANFLSLQDTLGLSGRVYVADSYIEGDVDYVWGYGTVCLERCELHSMHDGYIVQARNPAERGGSLFLDCRLTAASDVKKCWLARIEAERFPASHVGFVRCRMGPHIVPAGWLVTGAATPPPRFEEFGSMDLEGRPLDVTARDAASTQLTSEQAATQTAARLLAGTDDFKPGAEPLRMVIIGDSTVCEYPEASPNRGWGHYIQGYFTDGIKVVNLAASGRSTKTFIAEGRWKKALEEKPRYILIQFGHNDSHPAERPEATDAATTYPEFLRRYIDEARAIGAIPILVTPMVRRLFEGDHLRDELAPYAAAMQKVAAEKKVPLVHLHDSSKQLVEKLGDTKSMEFANTPTDRTHFNEKGAKAMADLVMQELPTAEPSLKAYLK